jgi:WD40 repeat protein
MNMNIKPIRMIRNDQFRELKKYFSSLTGMLTMVALVLGFGFSELQAQDGSASFYNQVGDEITNEITVPCGEQFTLTVGLDADVEVNAVNVTLNFDPSLLQVADGGEAWVDVSPEGFNVDLAQETDNVAGTFFIERGYISFLPPFDPPAAGQYAFVEVTFDVIGDVFSQPTVISYDADEIFVGNTSGVEITGDAPDFTVNVDCLDPTPANDDCENAEAIACGSVVEGSTANATADEVPFCGTSNGTGGGVWYSFTGTGDQVTASLCGSGYDTKIRVFTGACDALECVTGNDDFCGLQSQVDFLSEVGVEYSILVHGFGTASGDFSLALTCSDPPIPGCTNDAACNFNPEATEDDGSCVLNGDICELEDGSEGVVEDCECIGITVPENDLCSDATPVICGETVSGTTVGATLEGAPEESCGTSLNSSGGVWYALTPEVASNVTVTTCAEGGAQFDTKLGVFSGSCEELVCVGGDDDASNAEEEELGLSCSIGDATFNRASVVFFEADAGVTYYIYVTGFSSNVGNFDLSVFCEEIVCFADAGTMTADANPVILDGASVNISATPNGDAVVPEGFANAYVLTSGDDLVIQNLGEAPNFDVDMTGLYTIHSFVYDLDDEEALLAAVELGVTTGGEVLGLIEELGLCASLDVAGAPINVIPPPPANDLCENAEAVACGDVVEGSTVGATSDEAPFCGTGDGSGGGVWYSFMTDEESNVNMTLCGSDYDTKLRVYTGSCDALECVVGDDDEPCDGEFSLQSTVDFVAEPGVEYLVLVHGFSGNEGNFVYSVSCEPTCAADAGTMTAVENPVVLDGPSASISASANGDAVVPEGFLQRFVLTSGPDLVIQNLSADDVSPTSFEVTETGLYTIHSFVFDANDADAILEAVEIGVTTGGEVLGLIESLGLCASLDVAGAPINVVAPSDCESYEYYLADILEDGTTNIYEVSLSGSEAALSLVATSEYEVHIALNEADGMIYAVSKLDGSYRMLNPETGDFGPVEMLDTEVSEIIGATFNADGKLLISSQSENAIYSVMLGSNAVSVFDSYSPILGGDIDFGADGALYLATREGFGTFYIAIPDEIASDILIGDAPQLVTGVADTEAGNLIFSHRDATTLEVREYDGTVGTPYDITLGGESFMTFNGDLASGCADNRETSEDCEQVIYYTNQPQGGSYTLYSTVLNGDGTSTNTELLSGLGSSHIGVTPDGSTVYIVGGSDLEVYDTDAGAIVDVIPLTNEDGASINNFPACVVTEDGTLYIGGNGDNVYSVDPATGVATLITSAYDVNGGDLIEAPTGEDGAGELWLITRNNNTFTRLSDGTSFTVPVPEINGAAVLENGNVLLSNGDGDGDDALIEVSLADLSVVATYDTEFDAFNGDLAATCVDPDPNPSNPCLAEGVCNATSAVYVQGTTQGGGSLAAARTDVNNALGAPEGTDEMVFTTLGYGGSLTFEFDGVVPNGDGDDITVVETSFGNPGCEAYPEYADVYVSADGEDFYFIGTVCKSDNSVDISDAEVDLECVSYVQVANNDGLTTTGDGFDVDGIIAIHNCSDNGEGDGGEEAGIVANDNNSNNTLSSFPNPTNGLSQAIFVTGQTERATLEVYDMNGRLVEGLFSGMAEAGVEYRIDFDGLELPNGVYMYRLTTDSETIVEKFMIAK